MKVQAVTLLLIASLTVSDAARIFGFFPLPSKSHMAVNIALVKGLIQRGHEVTMVSTVPIEEKIPNFTQIQLDMSIFAKVQALFNDSDSGTSSPFALKSMNSAQQVMFLWKMGNLICESTLESEIVQKIIHSTDMHFDLVILEAFFEDCFIGFAHKFRAPVVKTCSYGGAEWMGDWFGNPHPYAYVPDGFVVSSDKMTFWQRLQNTVSGISMKLGRKFYYLPAQDAIIQKYFNYTSEMPSVYELNRSNALILFNHHFSISYPKPLMPNMIQVGGMHLKAPKPLPKDLQTYIDEAPDGVVYFSMGSNLQSADLPESKRQAFLEAFSKLKQKVLWKWETDTLPGQPSNVKLGKWLPQSDILAHPNVRLFITHGGLLSTQETCYRGVPVVGIPIFGDQRQNMETSVALGIGILLEFDNITTDSLTWAISEALQNTRYRENAQRISRIFQDQPLTPLEQAVFWTEYVIRHKGAPHMRSAALDLSWYQYFLLDVIAVLALAAASVLLVTIFIIKTIYRKCASPRKALVSKSKKTK